MPSKIYMRYRGQSCWVGPYSVCDIINSDIWKAWVKAKLPLKELIQIHMNGLYHVILDKLREATEANERAALAAGPEKILAVKGKFFFPTNYAWMVSKCEMLGLPMPTYPSFREFVECQPLTKPLERINVLGDGNCWFRSISYWISGTEDNHAAIRAALMKAYREDGRIIRIIGDVDAHLAEKKMDRLGAWATEIEMITTAMMLDVNIQVYTMAGKSVSSWNLFGRSGSFKNSLTNEDRCLYLEHVEMNHFVVVKSVVPKGGRKSCLKR